MVKLLKHKGNRSLKAKPLVFAAGLRDREKRRKMAEVSTRFADLTILTAEDPRTEFLEAILAEMAAGASGQGGQEGTTFWRIPDRGEALRFAVAQARPGDLVIACGKGHEQSMCFGETEVPWDDRTAMHAAVSELLGLPGPAMPEAPHPRLERCRGRPIRLRQLQPLPYQVYPSMRPYNVVRARPCRHVQDLCCKPGRNRRDSNHEPTALDRWWPSGRGRGRARHAIP